MLHVLEEEGRSIDRHLSDSQDLRGKHDHSTSKLQVEAHSKAAFRYTF